jgi:hypothetical protein
MTKAEIIEEFPVMGRLEQILKTQLLPEELDLIAEFVDGVEFGFSNFISEINHEVNPQSYMD